MISLKKFTGQLLKNFLSSKNITSYNFKPIFVFQGSAFFIMLTIGNIRLDNPFILAPLAGYSDLPFRLLCKQFGAGLVVSEMISCHGLFYKQAKTFAMLASIPDERPISFQLFGSDPEIMAEATQILSDFTPDIIDINMGCPVKKVTKNGSGAALMSTPKLAEKLISVVVKNSKCPVTVKFRSGVSATSQTATEFARMAEANGASAVTVHGRSWAQGFNGLSDWNVIGLVKDAVSIPVIGNGDILQYSDGLDMMEKTNCDGVMIGRGALGNPWVFSPKGRPSELNEIVQATLQHLAYIEDHLPTDRMIGCIKNHIGRYFKGTKGSAAMRKLVYDSPDFKTLKTSLGALIK